MVVFSTQYFIFKAINVVFEKELALQIFFVSAYALQFKHIDKRLSAWNRSEKNRIVYAVYADIRICRYLHMSHSQMLGKFEYGGGPIFKVVLEC